MSPINSRRKGKTRELEFIQSLLVPHWPHAKRNLDQFGDDKRDCLEVAGVHWQIKGVEKLSVWAALDQTITECGPHDLPVLAFRRNWNTSSLPSRSKWFCALEAEELIPLLRLREVA